MLVMHWMVLIVFGLGILIFLACKLYKESKSIIIWYIAVILFASFVLFVSGGVRDIGNVRNALIEHEKQKIIYESLLNFQENDPEYFVDNQLKINLVLEDIAKSNSKIGWYKVAFDKDTIAYKMFYNKGKCEVDRLVRGTDYIGTN